MRNKLLTIWAVILIGAIGAAVQGRMAVMIEELEPSALTKLYSRSIVGTADRSSIHKEARELYRSGKCQTTTDLYRLSAMLSGSQDPSDLLLAHDCALASMIEGFRPSLKAVRTSQKQFLLSIGFRNDARVKKGKESRLVTAVPILDRLEASWSEAAKNSSQYGPRSVALAVVN